MWDERYSDNKYIYGTKPNDFLKEQAANLAVGKTLCLAEGEGRNAVFLATLGHSVTAVDHSAVGLDKAQKLARANGQSIEIQVVDLADFNLGDGCWDSIVSIFAHVPPEIRRRIHGQIAKSLKPEGKLLLEAYTPEQLGNATGGPPDAQMMMSLRTLTDEIPGMQFVHAVELDREIVEGVGHTGVGSVVQLIASKS